MTSVPNVDANIAEIDRILTLNALSKANNKAAHLVVLPECCLFFGGQDKAQWQLAETIGENSVGSMQEKLRNLAIKHQVYLLAGSIPTKSSQEERFNASSLMYSPQGKLIGDYQKLHLFDVNVDDDTKSYQESRYTQPGSKIACVDIEGIKVGLAICYDLRFPELFRSMRQLGAQVICLPSAFTQVTGNAHWQPLLQARAIENQVYMVAGAQFGLHANGRETHGRAMVVDPWGTCQIFDASEQTSGLVKVKYDPELLNRVRANIPVAVHNRFSLNFDR